MIPNDMNSRGQVIKYMIDYLDVMIEDKLNDWEGSFVESVSEQFSNKGNLSDKQAEKLEQIYEKYS